LQGQAQEQGRLQTQFGQGLLGSGIDLTSQGYNPYKTQFGLGQALESAGQGAFDLGMNVGGQSSQAGANVGNTLYRGGMEAANSQAQANAYNPFASALSGLGSNQQFQQGVSNWFSQPPAPTYGSQVGGGGGFGSGSAWGNQDLGSYL
jgi:hypothetical protein